MNEIFDVLVIIDMALAKLIVVINIIPARFIT